MSIAIFPGSFDPITNGHIDIIKKSSQIFDKVMVAVSHNINKQDFISIEDRKDLIEKCLVDVKNVEIASYTGLTVDFAHKCGANVIVRGLRNSTDFDYEQQMAGVNYSLNSDIKTVFLLTKPEYSFISSSVVRDVFKNEGDISNLVPKPVNDFLRANF